MITEQEKQDIINAAVERTLLMIPEVIGNLMSQHAFVHKVNKAFYDAHPELKDKKNVVASVVEVVEGENPQLSYEDILKEAVPRIKEQIKLSDGLSMSIPSVVNRSFKDTNVNGEI